jgi:hypothetical protein
MARIASRGSPCERSLASPASRRGPYETRSRAGGTAPGGRAPAVRSVSVSVETPGLRGANCDHTLILSWPDFSR